VKDKTTVADFHLTSKFKYGYLLTLCVIVTISFFSTILLNQRGYQDAWILDGIVIPTAIFVFFFLVVKTFVQENKNVVILAASFLVALNLVAGLKYQLFYGTFDSPPHFRFTSELVSLGHIPETELYSRSYVGNPGMHIFMGSLSIISGISINDIFRFIIPAMCGVVPFIIYFITNDILDETIQRYVIIASSFPIVQSYIIYGTSLALSPYILLIAVFLRHAFVKKNEKEFYTISIVLSFSLIISHAVTSLFVGLLLIGTTVIFKSLELMRNKFLGRFSVSSYIGPSLLYVVLLMTWWMNISTFNLNTLAGYMKALFVGGPMSTPIPIRFFEVPFLPQLQVLAVFHSRDAIIAMLSLFGLFVFLRKLRRNQLSDKTEGFYLRLIVLLGVFTLFLFFQFVSGFGTIQYTRFVAYAMPLCTALVGLTLWRINRFLSSVSTKITIRNLAFASFLFVLVSSCLIQFYPCQPLVPRANVLSKNLPENEYLIDLGSVNTFYQKEMISFAERHSSSGRIASDIVTRYQIYGFSNHSFFSRHIWYSPLYPDQKLEWDLFLLHTTKACRFTEKVEYRTEKRIENLRLEAGNMVYDNGESFIISH